MANWKCCCGSSRELRSDGVVEACPACRDSEFDAMQEVIGIPMEPEFIDEIEEV